MIVDDIVKREYIVEALLTGFRDGTLDAHKYFDKLKSLDYPHLSQRLLPILRSSSQPSNLLIGALFLSASCTFFDESLDGESEKQYFEADIESAIINIATCKEWEADVRVFASIALLHYGSDKAKLSLMPHALSLEKTNPNVELKGVALQALWPHQLSGSELFSTLYAPPVGPHTSFHSFVSFNLVPGLSKPDIIPALRWVNERSDESEQDYYLRSLCDDIIKFSADFLEDPEIAREMSFLVRKRPKKCGSMAGVIVLNEQGKRLSSYTAF